MPRARQFVLTTFALAGTVMACATGGGNFPPESSARPAADVPARFQTDIPGTACRNPLVDPRDGTQIRLIRSMSATGDYEVPPGRYGVRANEVLRVRCATLEVVGVVRR